MILVDANVLLYAYDAGSVHHDSCRKWVETALSGPEPLRFAWVTLLAFLRLTTHPQVFERPLAMAEAAGQVAGWLDRPCAAILQPSGRHWPIFERLLEEGQVRGPLVMDAHLAALAIEHGAELCTLDRDFRRFDGLRLLDPTAESAAS